MKALIDIRATVQHISNWVLNKEKTMYIPIWSDYENSGRVCQVQQTEFEIAPPLFWIDCADDVLADQFWYNIENKQILPIVDAPEPPMPAAEEQPVNTGTQTL